jgi:hypothetical protein
VQKAVGIQQSAFSKERVHQIEKLQRSIDVAKGTQADAHQAI